jgi:toxin YoeB
VNVVFAPQASEDYLHWQSVDRLIVTRINRLIAEHRLVYRVHGDDLQILQARHHY